MTSGLSYSPPVLSWRRWLGFLAMTLVALVVAHNLVFLLAYGAHYEEALAHSGHSDAWGTAVSVVLAAGSGLLGLAVWRLHRLGLLARDLAGEPTRFEPATRDRIIGLVSLWLRLTVSTAVPFVIQENLEHQQLGAGLPGLSVLGSAEYPNALLVIAGIAFAVALVGCLVRWRRETLIARIVAAFLRLRLRPTRPARPPLTDLDRRPGSIVGRKLAVRAPPRPFPA
jgi:hypothetical protein